MGTLPRPLEPEAQAPAPTEPPTDQSRPPPHRELVLTPPILLAPPPADDPLGYQLMLERGALAPHLRTRAVEGRVVLRVLVLADGSVSRVDVEHSSGQAALDQAAVSAALSWRFDPATRDGVPIDAWVLIPVRFVLR